MQHAFLRSLDTADIVRPHHSGGGHRRYSRWRLGRAASRWRPGRVCLRRWLGRGDLRWRSDRVHLHGWPDTG